MSHEGLKLAINFLESEDRAFETFLNNKIKSFNNNISTFHREARKAGTIKSLYLILKDEAGDWVGGLAGKLYWNWLEIEDFFIPAEARGKGIGAKLLSQTETIALEHGYVHVQLTTYDFQARTFYEKQGYRVVGELEDYPPGSSYYWMRKDL